MPGVPRISSLLVKPVSALCNLDCAYCFYLDRGSDPYAGLHGRTMTGETLERLVDGYLAYSFPNSVFAFQGGEPTLASVEFYERLVALQQRCGRPGHEIGNSIQTNGVLLDQRWCALFREYNWLVGLSLDGPEPVHNAWRHDRAGHGSWRKVMDAVALLHREQVEFNVLCVVSPANVGRAAETYRFFRGLGVRHLQYIPLAEFDANGTPLPFTIDPQQYGRFLVETFDLWWRERRQVRIREFDNIAEALSGQEPGNCTLRDACDSYVVVEYNGDVYPCDFFVESGWKLGNVATESWSELGRRRQRLEFARLKSLPRPECDSCEYRAVCRAGCPRLRYTRGHRFEDLDFFCPAYKTLYARCLGPLKKDVARIRGPVAREG